MNMRDRIMRLIVFFDLPVETSADRRNYRKFRKMLLSEGFIMMQESMYSRMTIGKQSANFLLKRIKNQAPPEGLVQSMTITEKQYSEIEYITGEFVDDVVNRYERLTII